jgi:hypothetical protein
VLSPLSIDDDDLERGLAAIAEAVLQVSREPLPA